MSFLLFALPCFACQDAPLTGSCVPKPGGGTRHSRFLGRGDTSPLRGTRALNWPAMAALLHFLTASVRAVLSMRSLLTHFLGGPSTSTARSIEGCSGEVTGHQLACHLSPHIACLLTGRHQRSVSRRLEIRLPVRGLGRCPACHPERSEGSLRPSSQTLRCAQGDRHSLQMS